MSAGKIGLEGTTTQPPAAKSSARPRLFYMDNLRILLITLVILWHVAVTYGAPGVWPYREVQQPDDLTILVYTFLSAASQPYVLGFFFMIAGYFTPGSCDRKGPRRFLKDRLVRLGIPLLFYILVFDPLIYYALRVNLHAYSGSIWEHYGRHFGNYAGLGVGPLWFVEGLLIFVIIYGLWRWLARPSSDPAHLGGKAPSNAAIALFALALGVVTFVARIWLPMNSYLVLLGLPFAQFPQYIGLFVVGIVAYRRDWLPRISESMGRVWLRVAIFFIVVLFPVVFVLGGALEGNDEPFLGGIHWQSFAYSVWDQFVCVGMIIVLLVWFRRRFDRQGPLARAMSSGAYAAYFIHAPVLVLIGLAVRRIALYPLLKYALVAPVAAFVCFLLAHYVRKLPLARSVL